MCTKIRISIILTLFQKGQFLGCYNSTRGSYSLDPLPRKVGRVHYEAFQKTSSNKLGPPGICGPSLGVASVGIVARYTLPSSKGNIPRASKITTNKLEKILILS